MLIVELKVRRNALRVPLISYEEIRITILFLTFLETVKSARLSFRLRGEPVNRAARLEMERKKKKENGEREGKK